MEITYFHWGLHAWAIYAVVGLSLAYFSYRHKLPLTLRSSLYPLMGKRIYGPIGDVIDVFAILSTVFGVATSLGYGVIQINSGLHYLTGIDQSALVQSLIIVVVTGIAVASVATGLDKGIKILSEVNLGLAFCFMLLILILGPTLFILTTFLQNVGSYLSDIVNKTFNLYAYTPTDWIGGWTLFYWGWWIAWSPFVGIFIARISRGRTIREFILGVIFVPSAVTFAWMTIFGGSALNLIINQNATEFANKVISDKSVALFQFLEFFPFSNVLSVLAILMIVVFFVTSSDSGSLVVDTIASGGSEDTPLWQRVYWACMEGVVAIVLLLVGGLSALQTATIVSALPFAVILLCSCYGLLRSLQIENAKRISLSNTMNTTPVALSIDGDYDWRDRIDNIISLPRAEKVKQFINTVVSNAFEQVKLVFEEKGVSCTVKKDAKSISLKVHHGDEQDFYYIVSIRSYEPPSFVLSSQTRKDDNRRYFIAEVSLREGGQSYDLMGYTEDQVIHDILEHYEKHIHFLALIR